MTHSTEDDDPTIPPQPHLPPAPRFLTLDEVAATLRVDERTVLALVERGELQAMRVGDDGPWRVETDLLETFIDDRYEAERRALVAGLPEHDDFSDWWAPRIPEDDGSLNASTGDETGPAPDGTGRPRLRLIDTAEADAYDDNDNDNDNDAATRSPVRPPRPE